MTNPLLRSLLKLVRGNGTLLMAPTGNTDEAAPVSATNPLHVTLPGLTDNSALEALAQQQITLLTQLGTYNDQVESILGTVNGNVDGIEALLSALGVKDDNVLTKLDQLIGASGLGLGAVAQVTYAVPATGPTELLMPSDGSTRYLELQPLDLDLRVTFNGQDPTLSTGLILYEGDVRRQWYKVNGPNVKVISADGTTAGHMTVVWWG